MNGDSLTEVTDRYPEPLWNLKQGLVGLLVALAITFSLSGALAITMKLAGVKDIESSTLFTFLATGAQEIAFVIAAVIFAAAAGKVTLQQFGFRKAEWSAVLWALLAVATYLILAGIYQALFHPPQDELPTSFGAGQSTVLAIATGVLVIGIAPLVEEFFFRGFLYKSFRNTIGIWPAALLSGLLFALIHLKPIYIFPLFALGTVLALLHQKTNSLWPCIAVHAANNAIAFTVVT